MKLPDYTYLNRMLPVFLSFIFLSGSILGQGNDDAQYDDVRGGIKSNLKAYNVYTLSKKVDYGDLDDGLETFNYGLLGTDTMTLKIYRSFKFAEKFRRANRRPIRVYVLESLEDIENIHVLYVSNTGAFNIEDVNERIKGKHILLMTENYPLDSSMINFTEDGTVFRYEVNIPNMRRAGLEPNAVLKTFSHETQKHFNDAGSIVDLVNDSVDVELTKEDIRLIVNDYNQKLEQIEHQTMEIAEQTAELEKLMEQVDHQKEQITIQTAELMERKRQMKISEKELTRLLEKNKLSEIALNQTRLQLKDEMLKLDDIRNIFESEKQNYHKKVRAQDSLMNIRSEELAFVDKKLADHKSRLSKKEEEIKLKEATIEEQNWILMGGILMLIAVLGIGVLIYRNYRNKKKANEELASKNSIIEQQKTIVEEKNREVIDSINYAKRLQGAILPSPATIKTALPNSFVLYKPKDIVAGDFYWVEEMNGSTYFAAADCTGHGVPGAMVSVVCSNALNRAVTEFKLTNPGKILDKVRDLVIETFEKADEDVKDGMDIALCKMTPNGSSSKLEYAGANNPLWIIRNGQTEIEEIKPDKQPIGQFMVHKPFTTHAVEVHDSDQVYIFSDGYADQFGGHKGKKFKASNLKKLILSVKDEPMDVQVEKINHMFEEWRGDLEQLDDVCVIGARVGRK